MPPILRSHDKKPIPSKHLSEFTRGRILRLHKPQMSYCQISHLLEIPLNTFKDTILKEDQERKERTGSGRYPETTKLQDDAMVEEALSNCNTSYSEIANKVAPNVSAMTVRRRLAQKHLKNWLAQERVHLDEDLAVRHTGRLSLPLVNKDL